MFKSSTEDDLDMAMHFYELALEKDPEFALAYSGICCVWLFRQQSFLVSPDEAGPKAMAAIQRALELDSTLAEVHLMLAGVHIFGGSFDWKAGEEALKKAIAINPNHARAHGSYSLLLVFLGRPEEAMEHIERALKLDPYNLFVRGLYTSVLLRARRYDDCISVCHANNITDSYSLYAALYATGRYEESLEAMRLHYMSILKDFNHVFDQYEKLGYIGTLKLEIDTLLEQSKSKFLPPNPLADLYLFVGNKKRALDCAEQSYEMRDPTLPFLLTDPNYYDSLQDEPRYQELLRKMNLPLGK